MARQRPRRRGDGSVYQREDGKWVGRLYYRRGTEVHRPFVLADTEQQTWALLDDERAKLQQGGATAPARLTVEQYLKGWLASCRERGLEPRTIEDYDLQARRIAGLIGHIRLRDVEPHHIESVYRHHSERGLAPRSLHHIHRVARMAFGRATAQRYLTFDPAAVVDAPKVPRKRPQAFSLEEVERYFRVLTAQQSRYRVLLLAASLTGMRESELFGLRWECTDLAGLQVTVDQKIQYVRTDKPWGKQGQRRRELYTGPPKTPGSQRAVPLIPQLADELRRHRDQQRFERQAAGPIWQEHGLVFCRLDGRPLRPQHVLPEHYEAVDEAGIRRFPIGKLRHTTASLLAALGVELVVISRILGHSSIGITELFYSDIGIQLQRKALDKLGEALFGR